MTEILNQNNMLEEYCIKYNNFLLFSTIYYIFNTLAFAVIENKEIFIISLTNFLFAAFHGLVIQYFEEFENKSIILKLVNVFLLGNIILNIFLFSYKYFAQYLVSCIISLFFIFQNKILLDVSKNINMKNNLLNNRINNVFQNIKNFTPEQKQLFKEHLIQQMQEIITLKKELQDKVNKKDN